MYVCVSNFRTILSRYSDFSSSRNIMIEDSEIIERKRERRTEKERERQCEVFRNVTQVRWFSSFFQSRVIDTVLSFYSILIILGDLLISSISISNRQRRSQIYFWLDHSPDRAIFLFFFLFF